MRAGMLVILFVGAADADATEQQRVRLRDEVRAALDDQSVSSREAMVNAARLTTEVMGTEWRPDGWAASWDSWLAGFLAGENTDSDREVPA